VSGAWIPWAAFAGAVIAAVAGFFKAPAEKQSIIVTAAQGAVVVQSGVIDELREELARVARLERECREERVTLAGQIAQLQRVCRDHGWEIP
jgi:hypothetical protein